MFIALSASTCRSSLFCKSAKIKKICRFYAVFKVFPL
nr:MAG TPA: hypothetical protein [Caudoviricetes sp.]